MFSFWLLPLVLSLHGTPPAVPLLPSSIQAPPACARETEDGRKIVTYTVTMEVHARRRAEYGIPRAAPEAVRLLTDSADAATCAKLRDVLEQRARVVGGTLRNPNLEFYQVGDFYFAALPAGPSKCRPPADGSGICIDLRWRGLSIFDQNLNLLASIAT